MASDEAWEVVLVLEVASLKVRGAQHENFDAWRELHYTEIYVERKGGDDCIRTASWPFLEDTTLKDYLRERNVVICSVLIYFTLYTLTVLFWNVCHICTDLVLQLVL